MCGAVFSLCGHSPKLPVLMTILVNLAEEDTSLFPQFFLLGRLRTRPEHTRGGLQMELSYENLLPGRIPG